MTQKSKSMIEEYGTLQGLASLPKHLTFERITMKLPLRAVKSSKAKCFGSGATWSQIVCIAFFFFKWYGRSFQIEEWAIQIVFHFCVVLKKKDLEGSFEIRRLWSYHSGKELSPITGWFVEFHLCRLVYSNTKKSANSSKGYIFLTSVWTSSLSNNLWLSSQAW